MHERWTYLDPEDFLSITPTLIPIVRAIATRPIKTTMITVINVFLDKAHISFGRELHCSTSSTFELLACSTTSGSGPPYKISGASLNSTYWLLLAPQLLCDRQMLTWSCELSASNCWVPVEISSSGALASWSFKKGSKDENLAWSSTTLPIYIFADDYKWGEEELEILMWEEKTHLNFEQCAQIAGFFLLYEGREE